MSIVLDVPRGGASVPHGGRNFRLMVLCHSGALLHSKNNAMFIKHFKPWVEVIGARCFLKLLLLNIVHFAILFTKSFAAMKAYVNFGLSTSHGVVNRSSSVSLGCCSTAIR